MFSVISSRSVTATAATRRGPGWTVGFASAAMLVSYLPFSAVNGSLGILSDATRASTSDLQWLTDAFALALAVTVLPAGAVSERLGRRATVVLGLALIALGAVIGLTAGGSPGPVAIPLLWAAQAVAGVGGGAVMSASLALITAAAPDVPARRRGIAIWAAAVTCGLGVGPFLAAAVIETVGLRWLFAPILVLAVATGATGHFLVPEPLSARRSSVDVAGMLLSALTVGAVVAAVIRAGSTGWSDAFVVEMLAIALVGLAAFLLREHRAADPVLPLTMFSSRRFTAAGLAAATMLFSIVGAVFVLSLLLDCDGDSEIGIALQLGCLFAANAVASLAAATLQARIGAARVLGGGLFVAAAGAAFLATAGEYDVAHLAWRLALFGLGSGLVMSTASALAVSDLPPASAGPAGAANNALRQLGAALGAAVLGSVLAAQLTSQDFTSAVRTCLLVLTGVLTVTAVTCTALLLPRRR